MPTTTTTTTTTTNTTISVTTIKAIARLSIVPRILGERGGSVVECRTPEREVRGSRPTSAVLCP